MKKVALLLDHEASLYEQLLAKEANAAAAVNGISLMPPVYAGGSSFAQLNQMLACTKGDGRADAVMIMPAGAESHLAAARLVTRAGISMVFLNRIPEYTAELRVAHPELLVSSVAPDQEAIGRIQAAQCHKLAPQGGYVLLVLGVVATSSAALRRKGFMEHLGPSYDVNPLEGRWIEEDAFKAVLDGLRLGLERDREVAAVVCQNDRMAAGARRALLQEAQRKGTSMRVPLIGCDGLVSEGQDMVRRGDLQATVVMPSTTPTGLQMLVRYWQHAEQGAGSLLQPESYPALGQLAV